MMPPPSTIPMKRKKFVWTDADENELRDSCKIFVYNPTLARIKTYDEN
jgi:hypothetical protein